MDFMKKAQFNNAHVFVVDSDSFPVHRDRLFCGVKNPNKETIMQKTGAKRPNTSHYGLIADLVTLRVGDYIIFYQMRREESKLDRGFRGIYKVVSNPFFSNEDIEGLESSQGDLGSKDKKVFGKCPYCQTEISDKAIKIEKEILSKSGKKQTKKMNIYICQECEKELKNHILPNRVLIEPLIVFEGAIDDNTAYIDRNFIDLEKDLPILWTMLFRKTSGEGRARSITHILPEEYNKLKKIFETNYKESKENNFQKYVPKDKEDIKIPLDTDSDGELKIEAFLEAWLMQNIGINNIEGFDDVIGNKEEIEYFGNNVLWGIGGEKVDILIVYNNGKERTRADVIELKKGSIVKKDIEQIKDYTKWMAQLVFGDDSLDSKKKIQPILIGLNADESRINEAKKLITDTQKPILMEYIIDKDKLKFKRVL
jgi:predicted RNA-binding protein